MSPPNTTMPPAPLTGPTSPGVLRIEALTTHIATRTRAALFLAILLLAWAYGLDGTLRYTFQPYATAAYDAHARLAAVNVARAVTAAAVQPAVAKMADVVGRTEMLGAAVGAYVLGTVLEAASTSLGAFCAGAVLYQIGYSAVILLVEVLIADLSSTRARLFFSYIPALPFLVNTWISGNVSSAVLTATDWRWGIGMWGIIFLLCATPLLTALFLAHRRAAAHAPLTHLRTPYQLLGARRLAIQLVQQLDLLGLLLLVAVFALILVPLTVAGGGATAPAIRAAWTHPRTLAPLAVGLVLLPVFVAWELRAAHPMVPFRLLRDRGVWAPLGVAVMLNFAWYLQGDFLYTVLIVSFGQSITAATRITGLYSFASVLTGVLVGAVVYRVRRLKPFIVTGTLLFLLAFGLLVRFRGGAAGRADAVGLIAAQILLGVAGGFFPFAALASIQTATPHEHLAAVTALYLASYHVGAALGNCVSGAVWSNSLPAQLASSLRSTLPDGEATALAAAIYADPLSSFPTSYPWGTPERAAVASAYRAVQRNLCLTGLALCVPLIGFALLVRNPRLTGAQSLVGTGGDGGAAEMGGRPAGNDDESARPADGAEDADAADTGADTRAQKPGFAQRAKEMVFARA